MALIDRKCMIKDCSNSRLDRTWFDDDYDENNPFMCQECIDKKEINSQPLQPQQGVM